MNLIYHYSCETYLDSIIQSGKLIVSNWENNNNVKPAALWLSTNTIWENTATKMIEDNDVVRLLTKDEQHNMFGLIRFIIDFNSITTCNWNRYKYSTNTTIEVYNSMEQYGVEIGANPNEWFATFLNIPLQNCIGCDIWDGTTWQPHPTFTKG